MFNFVLLAWVTAGLIFGLVFVPPAQNLVATPIAFLHVPMAFAMEIAFVLAAWHGFKWLRTRQAKHDAASLAFAEVGAIFGLIATFSGSLWSRLNWGSFWSWDPQQIGIVATLLTYGALFALRGAVEDESKRRNAWAVYALLGVLSAIFWTFVFRRLGFGSLHPEAPTVTSSALFKMALWFNIIGYSMVMIKIASLRAKIEILRERALEADWKREELTA